MRLRQQNRKLLQWIDRWFDTPDDRSEAWWNDFEADLRSTRLTFRANKTE